MRLTCFSSFQLQSLHFFEPLLSLALLVFLSFFLLNLISFWKVKLTKVNWELELLWTQKFSMKLFLTQFLIFSFISILESFEVNESLLFCQWEEVSGCRLDIERKRLTMLKRMEELREADRKSRQLLEQQKRTTEVFVLTFDKGLFLFFFLFFIQSYQTEKPNFRILVRKPM